MFHRDFLVPSGSGLGFRGLSPFFSFVSFLKNGVPNEVFLRMNVVETWFVAVWGRLLLVPGRVPGLASLLLWHFVPSSFPGSFWFQVGF